MISLRLPFGYKITLDRDQSSELGVKLMSIDIRQRGASVNLAVPSVEINPRAILLAAVHQETYIKDYERISTTIGDIETGLWNNLARKYRVAGDPMAYTRALNEIVVQKNMLISENDKDVS